MENMWNITLLINCDKMKYINTKRRRMKKVFLKIIWIIITAIMLIPFIMTILINAPKALQLIR